MKALVFMGAGELPAASYAILVHLCFFLPITIWGISALGWYGIQLGETLTQARLAKEVAPGSREGFVLVARVGSPSVVAIAALPDAFLRALVNALVPWDMVGLSKREQHETLESVVQFVRGQVKALSANLGVLFALGMLGFRIVVGLTHLRGFTRVSKDEQVRIVESWAYGKMALSRQLFRVLRSTALLAFFDHPNVRKAMRRPRLIALACVPNLA
jgi:hypothetical protein